MGYEEHIRAFLGKELLYPNVTPVKTLHKHDMQWKDEPQEVQLGWSHVHSAKLEEALKRSGRNGTFFYGDVDAIIIRLSSKVTITQALAMLDFIPKYHLGLVTTANGFAIRVKKEHELIAKANLDQEYAELVGKELMLTAPTEHNKYVIQGLPRHTTLQKSSKPCKILPT